MKWNLNAKKPKVDRNYYHISQMLSKPKYFIVTKYVGKHRNVFKNETQSFRQQTALKLGGFYLITRVFVFKQNKRDEYILPMHFNVQQ